MDTGEYDDAYAQDLQAHNLKRNKIMTAQELLDSLKVDEGIIPYISIRKAMIEFAEMHNKRALEIAEVYATNLGFRGLQGSIRDIYPPENIK